MKSIVELNKLNHRIFESKHLRHIIDELKKPLTKDHKRKVTNGTVGFVLLFSALAIAAPLVKSQLQTAPAPIDNDYIQTQQNTVNFINLNNNAINLANTTLGEIYIYISTGYPESQRLVLEKRYQELLAFQSNLITTDSIYVDMSENTTKKISVLLIAIENFLDKSTPFEEDIIHLNLITDEFRMITDKEQTLLLKLFENLGISYEILENGQIQYEYIKAGG